MSLVARGVGHEGGGTPAERRPGRDRPGPGPMTPRRGLARNLTWLSIVMVTLALSGVGAGLIFLASRTQREAMFQLQRRTAEQAAQLISGYVTRAQGRLAFFLETTPLAILLPGSRQTALENLLLHSEPLYSEVTFLDKEGWERAKVSGFHTFLEDERKNRADLPAFLSAIAGKPFMGDIALFEDTGLLTMTVALPVGSPETGIAGVLIAEVNLTHLWQRVAEIRVGASGYAYLVDTGGRFVAFQKPAEVLKRHGEDMRGIPPVATFVRAGAEGAGQIWEYRGLVHEEVIGVYAPIPGTRWAVLVEQPTAEAFAGIREMRRTLYGLMLLSLFLVGWAVSLLSRRLVAPIRTLTALAERLGRGDLETEFREVERQDEVGILSHAFKEMQRELRGLYQGLRNKVAEIESTEATLRESEEKFRTLVEQSPLGISHIGKDGHYLYINPQFHRMFGYGLADVPTGRDWFQRAFPDADYRKQVIAAWVTDERSAGIGTPRPQIFTVTCQDGSLKEIEFRPVMMESGEQIVLYEDITERSRMERQIQGAQRLEALGTLAGGIAHDFNNLMMGIQGHVTLLSAERGLGRNPHILAAEECLRSAKDLTGRLLGLARGGKYEMSPIEVNALIEGTAAMFGRTRKEIRIHLLLHPGPVVVEADRSQLEQVLLNLCINAWQAMPGGGDLTLGTGIAPLDEAFCLPHNLLSGDYCRIWVRDTGIGMDEATRQRVFDPFFTTKEKERGTGLGLASVYGIVRNHKGLVTVESRPDEGATFSVYLPLSDKTPPGEESVTTGPLMGSETLLLVDDEAMILDVGREMLEVLGYRVLTCGSGEEAIRTLAARGEEIALVILDMVMPGMDGSRTFDRLREIRPNIPVMLASGYSRDGQALEILGRGCNGFIQKPFDLSELSREIRKILGP